jgi:hypothetical protein
MMHLIDNINSMQKNIIIAVLVSAALFGGLGYMAGKKSSVNSVPPDGQAFARGGNPGGGARLGRGAGSGMIGGEVIAKDMTSITVKLRGTQADNSAGSKIIFLSDATQVTKSAQGSTTDLSVGTQISVFGTTNADGSVNAQSIQIRPEGSIRSTTTPN